MHQRGGSGGRRKALRCAGAAGYRCLYMRDQFLRVRENFPKPHNCVPSHHNMLAVGTECDASRATIISWEWLTDLPSRHRVPDARCIVVRRGDDALSVGTERRTHHHRAPMASQRLSNWLAGLCVPYPDRVVVGRSDNARAVRTKGCASHVPPMALERFADWLARLGVPHLRRVVLRRGHDGLSVGAECCNPHNTLMASEWLSNWLTGLGVPHPRGVVTRRGNDALAVAAESHTYHGLGMAVQRLANLLPVLASHTRAVL
jgi:hypothetical protein